jgi:hypothetical protein
MFLFVGKMRSDEARSIEGLTIISRATACCYSSDAASSGQNVLAVSQIDTAPRFLTLHPCLAQVSLGLAYWLFS